MTTRIATLPPLPKRPKDGHKGLFGRVLIIGGQTEMIGAPAFAGAAALRSGAGLVQIAAPASILANCLSICPELIGLSLPAPLKKWTEAAQAADAIVIGPGLGQSAMARKYLEFILKRDKPVVVDADALNLLATKRKWPAKIKAQLILTPHPGEMRRLGILIGKTEQSQTSDDRVDTALQAAKVTRQTIILKGANTVITDGSHLYINTTGDSSLSKAGTGDVLTGICATLLSQGWSSFNASAAAVWIHGTAGQLAGDSHSPRSVLATDVISHIGQSFLRYESRFGSS